VFASCAWCLIPGTYFLAEDHHFCDLDFINFVLDLNFVLNLNPLPLVGLSNPFPDLN
jgi:hypothetical protein